jgi:hypothetical protein
MPSIDWSRFVPTTWRAKTVASVVAGLVGATVVVGTAAVAITHAVGSAAAPVVAAPTVSPSAVATPTPTAAPLPTVGALRNLTPPDAVALLPASATAAQLAQLRSRQGVTKVTALSRGRVEVSGHRLDVVGVPLSTIRGYTPSLTAKSLPLWQSVARGDLTVGYANSGALHRAFGKLVVASGTGGVQAPLRVGAFATIGLPGAQGMVSQPIARAFDLGAAREVLVVAPKISLDALNKDLTSTLGKRAHVVVTRAAPVDQSIASKYALKTIPSSYLDLYRRAATTCPGVPWTVLAGIGTVETGNGRDVHRSTKGAEGPMQFIPSTWATYGYDADGDGKANVNDPVDAVFSAARYLCAAGAGRGGEALDDAIFAYNHAWWYVKEVIDFANSYA